MHGRVIPALLAGLLASAGCAYRLGPPEVDWGEAAPLPLVHPSTDPRRWYVPIESEQLGPHVFFVDSGYSYSTCDDDLVRALGLETRGRVRVKGELGHLVVTKAKLPPMMLGGHRVEGLVCQVRDLQQTSSIRDPREVPVAGVLGVDVLRRFHVVFDPEVGELSLLPPRETPDLPRSGDGVVRLRRELLGIRARIPLIVDGHETWPVVDTGASETYLDAARLGLRPDWEQENVTVRGTGSSGSELRTLRFYEVDVALGGHALGEVTITGRERPPMVPGLVGLDVLGRFRAEYDFDRSRARFTPVQPVDLPSWHHWRTHPPGPSDSATGVVGATLLDANADDRGRAGGSDAADLSLP